MPNEIPEPGEHTIIINSLAKNIEDSIAEFNRTLGIMQKLHKTLIFAISINGLIDILGIILILKILNIMHQ